jgi:hypothetical protein
MDAIDDPYPLRSRCPDHGLALGPEGTCVICRREAAGARLSATGTGADLVVDARGSRGVARIVAAAMAGVVLLGGVAFARGLAPARTHTPELRAAALIEAAPAPIAPVEEPRPALAERGPMELPSPPAQHPPAQPPQQEHDYLGEAYAALDKRALYDAPQPGHVGAAPAPHGTCTPIYRRYGYGYGGAPRATGGGYVPGNGPSTPSVPPPRTGGGGRGVRAPM